MGKQRQIEKEKSLLQNTAAVGSGEEKGWQVQETLPKKLQNLG